MSIDNDWATLGITPMRGYVNLYRDDSAQGGYRIKPAPAVLLQHHPDGRRRTVFAAIVGAELVPAVGRAGHLGVISKSVWDGYAGLGSRHPAVLLAAVAGGPHGG